MQVIRDDDTSTPKSSTLWTSDGKKRSSVEDNADWYLSGIDAIISDGPIEPISDAATVGLQRKDGLTMNSLRLREGQPRLFMTLNDKYNKLRIHFCSTYTGNTIRKQWMFTTQVENYASVEILSHSSGTPLFLGRPDFFPKIEGSNIEDNGY